MTRPAQARYVREVNASCAATSGPTAVVASAARPSASRTDRRLSAWDRGVRLTPRRWILSGTASRPEIGNDANQRRQPVAVLLKYRVRRSRRRRGTGGGAPPDA